MESTSYRAKQEFEGCLVIDKISLLLASSGNEAFWWDSLGHSQLIKIDLVAPYRYSKLVSTWIAIHRFYGEIGCPGC